MAGCSVTFRPAEGHDAPGKAESRLVCRMPLFARCVCAFAEVHPTVRVEVITAASPCRVPVSNWATRAPQTVSEGSATAIVSLGPLKVTVSKDGFFPGVVILPDETTAAQLSPDFIGGLRKPGWR